jgi:hypothetical protein
MGIDNNLLYFLISRIGRDRLYQYIDPYKDSLKTFIIPIDILNPHEDVIESHIDYIAKDIVASGYIKYPIVVDSRTLIILDGHHRAEILKRLGIKYIPAFLVDYIQDYIDVYPLRKDIPVSKTSIIDMAILKKSVYPPKTSKHIYHGFTILPSYTPLSILELLSDKIHLNSNTYSIPILKLDKENKLLISP